MSTAAVKAAGTMDLELTWLACPQRIPRGCKRLNMQARCILESSVVKLARKSISDDVEMTCDVQNTEVDVMSMETFDDEEEKEVVRPIGS